MVWFAFIGKKQDAFAGHIKSENVQSIAVTALECMNCCRGTRLHRKSENAKKGEAEKAKHDEEEEEGESKEANKGDFRAYSF